MRNVSRIAVLALACSSITPAVAQTPSAPPVQKQPVQKPPATKPPAIKPAQSVQITPKMTVPANRDGVKLTLPPDMRAITPTLTVPQLDLAKAAKVSLAASWGLTISQSALQPSFFLTPQQPYLASGASIYIANDVPTTPNYTPTAAMPYGSIAMSRTPSGAWWVGLRDVPATTKDWLIVECYVAGAPTYHASVDFAPTPSVRGGHSVIRTGLTANNGKIGFVVEPSTLAKRGISVGGRGPAGSMWTFGGCEITPARP